MSVDLNEDGGRHKAQLERRRGSVECLDGAGEGKEKRLPGCFSANMS